MVIGVAAAALAGVVLHSLRRKWSFSWAKQHNPERDAHPLTARIWSALDVTPGMRVADVGAGAGYFALELARRVGDQGSVLATDRSPDAFLHLVGAKRTARLENLTVRWNWPLRFGLPRGAFDRILLVNVFPFEEHRDARSLSFLRQIAEALCPGGRAVIFADAIHTVDWRPPYGTPLARNQSTPQQIIELARGLLEVTSLEEIIAGPAEVGKLPGYLLVLARP